MAAVNAAAFAQKLRLRAEQLSAAERSRRLQRQFRPEFGDGLFEMQVIAYYTGAADVIDALVAENEQLKRAFCTI